MGTYGIERYLNVRSAYAPSFGPEGDRLAFLMDTTGVPQVWTVDRPRSWPIQRTFFDERVTFVSASPERSELAFGMDEGGNERAQLFRLDLEDGGIHELTAMPAAKHRWGGWSHDGEQIAFASNRRDESVFDVYVQNRDAVGDEATLVFEGDGWFSVGGWSPSDDRLILHEAHASFDHDLYVLEVSSGATEHLTPHEGDVRYQAVNWSPDGEALYLVTDEEGPGRDGDTLSLARLDLETGALETMFDGGRWNVDGLALDDETGRFVASRNVDGYTELTVGERSETTSDERSETTGGIDYDTFPVPELPGGVAGGVTFDEGAQRFAITVTGDRINPNVFVVDVETGDVERWTDAPTAGIPRETFVESQLVHVESFDGLEVPGFLSLPADGSDERSSDEGYPVVVDIHGGPESQRRPSFARVKQYLLQRGYAYFEPNVRGSSGYGQAYSSLDDVEKRMDSVADIRACVEWLEDRPAIDPDRIACMGGSYGGFMVLAAMTEYPDLWAAGVDVVGIANFVTFLENTGDWRRSLREAEYGSLEDDREFLEEISPIHRLDRIRAPLFVIHGENDPRVPVSEAEQVIEEVGAAGVPARSLIFEDEGHGITKLENRIEAYSAVAEFLDEHV